MLFKLHFSLIIIATTFLVVTFYYLFRLIRESHHKTPVDRLKLIEIEKSLLRIENSIYDLNQYFRYSKFKSIQDEFEKHKKQTLQIKNVFLKNEKFKLLNKLDTHLNDLPRLRDQINNEFFEQEKKRAAHVFTDSSSQELLTEEQLKAVLYNDNRNLIIAGAGSGKTRVIDFKIRYLVNHLKVNPEKILLLSFSRKSAGDLVKKISENTPGVVARTIHSFSAQTIKKQGRQLFDESKNELGAFVIKALVQTLKDQNIFRYFEIFYEKFFSDVKPLIFYKNIDELREDLKKVNSKLVDIPDPFGEIKARRALKTLRGEYVRSIDERFIADFLYLQDIKYEYEPKYTYTSMNYYPDFFLNDYNIYLEHFALTKSGQPPSYFDNPKKYIDGIEWKRRIHTENNTKLIESYSYLLNDKGSSIYLSTLLTQNGISVKDLMSDEKVYSKISRQFSRLFIKFYNTFKLSGLSVQELKQKYTLIQYTLFLQIFERFLVHYKNLVDKENKMDFSDLVIDAITKIKSDGLQSYDYIIVDEFQDTSHLAIKLLDSIYELNPQTTFLSVGDDWQSIYGFNGSDVTILSDFKKNIWVCPYKILIVILDLILKLSI